MHRPEDPRNRDTLWDLSPVRVRRPTYGATAGGIFDTVSPRCARCPDQARRHRPAGPKMTLKPSQPRPNMSWPALRPQKNGSSAGCCAWRPRLDPQKPSSEAVFTAAVPCFQRPNHGHRRSRAPPTPMRRHEQRWKVHTRRNRRSRALVGRLSP